MKSKILSGLAALLLVVNAGQGAFAMRGRQDRARRVPHMNSGVVRARNSGQVEGIGRDLLELEDFHYGAPLILAAFLGNTPRVRALLERGANPNVIDGYNRTPLSAAMHRGDADMTIALLDAGADPTLANYHSPGRETPLQRFNAGEYNFGDRTDEVRAHLSFAGPGILRNAAMYPLGRTSIAIEEIR